MNEEQKRIHKLATDMFSFPIDGDKDHTHLRNICMGFMHKLAPYVDVDLATHIGGYLTITAMMEQAKLVEARKTNEKLEALLVEVQLLNQKERA